MRARLLTLATLALLMQAAPAAAKPLVTITSPGRVLAGPVAFAARAAGRPQAVYYYLDGHRVFSRGGGSGSIGTTVNLSPGRHRLTVVAHYAHRSARASLVIRVRRRHPAPAPGAGGPTPDPTPTPAPPLTLPVIPVLPPAQPTPPPAPTPPAPPSISPLTIGWTAPSPGASVSGVLGDPTCEATVSDPSQVREVDFSLDGAPLNVEHLAPYTCDWDTTTATPGTHTLTATVVDDNGLTRSASEQVVVANPSNCTPAAGDPSGWPSWSSGFETGNFTEWSWWGQGDPTYAGLSVVSPASYGVPVCQGGKIARFEITAQDVANGYYNSKLYKSFTVPGSGRTYPPADVSGSYVAWYYIPPGYQLTDPGGVNLLQYKTKLYSLGGTSEPTWELDIQSRSWVDGRPQHQWVGAEPAGANDPVAVTNYGNSIDGWDNPNARMNTAMALPVGRWFEVRAAVHQGSRIDWYVDGRLLVTNYESEYHVGPIHGSDAEDWTFGIGNYSGNVGVIYADDVAYFPGP